MDILPDLLKPGLKIVFCGMAAGTRSTKLKAYYAGIGNKFWSILSDVGLTPYKLAPSEFNNLLDYGVGLTDLVKSASGNDAAIVPSDNDIKMLKEKIELYKPGILAFTGKGSAKYFLGHGVDYGFQKEGVGHTKIFVLPSTSQQANRYWDKKYWHELARSINQFQRVKAN